MQDMSDMMYNNEEYASGLSSDEINNLIMEEEATRQNAERLLLMDIKDDEEVLHFVANLDKADPVTGTVDFDLDDTSTHMVEFANKYSATNSRSMGTVEMHELCNFKCGRKEGHPRWRCKCVTIPNTKPLSTMDLGLFKLKQWEKEFKTRNMLKKKAVEAFNEHCEDVYTNMEMERAVEEITFTEEELLEDVDYDGDNDDEIDYRNIDGMELESSSDEEEEITEVQLDDDVDQKGENTCSLPRCNKLINGEGVVAKNDVFKTKYCSEECLQRFEQDSHEVFDASGSLEDLLDDKQVSDGDSDGDSDEEEDDDNDDTDDEEKFILYHLVTNGDSGYEKVELNLDILQQAVGLPTRNDFPNIVDLPTWPNCCVESQSHKKCQCGEFVKEKVVKLHKELLTLYGTRQRKNVTKRLEYNKHDAELMINTRLERLKELKNEKKKVEKTVVKNKTTVRRRAEKRKYAYEIRRDLVLHEDDFCHDIEGRRGKSFACPICGETAERKPNAMQHAIAKHHCTVMRLNKEKRLEKFVLRHFKCMDEDCKWKGSHSFPKFQQHMSRVHCRDFITSNTSDNEFYVQGHESCIVRPLKHGCDRSDCNSYAPCEVCSESYGCSDMNCGCWLPRPTCNSNSCNTCKVREGKKRKLSRYRVV